jgi:hypothetical protein
MRLLVRHGRLSRTRLFDWNDMAILSFEDGTKQCQRNAMMTTNMMLLLYFSFSFSSSLTLAVTRLGRDALES